MIIKKILSFIFPYLLNKKNRIEWVKKQLKKIPAKQTILDVGAGECRYEKYCGHLQYTSQDLAEYDGVGDKFGLQTSKWNISEIDIVSDILKIPVKNSSFDNILCTEVLEHVPYPDFAIKEISRILKKGGKLILTAPFSSQTHQSPNFYSTGFGISWYKKILNDNKFKIIKIEINGNFFDFLNQEICRLPMVIKRYSNLGVFSLLFYLVIMPFVFIIWLMSKISKGSENQLCFGYHVIAIKK